MDLLNNSDLVWDHYEGTSLGRKVDYWGAILGVHDDAHVEVLYRWEPNAYCHFHRHISPISSVVLAGDLKVIDIVDGMEVGERWRRAGDYLHKEVIEDHIEQAGPNGALVMFSLYAPDGILTERLADDGSVIHPIRVEDIRARAEALL